MTRGHHCPCVREQHPLQQGLRHLVVGTSTEVVVREQHPLQQGLRQCDHRSQSHPCGVREQHPLQQGLRLYTKNVSCVLVAKSENSIHYNKD